MERSNAALYGKGVFTTILIHHDTPFLWEKHWKRVSENAAKVGIDLSEFSENTIQDSLIEAVRKNKVVNGRVRITFSDETESKIWAGENCEGKTILSIITAGLRPTPDKFNLTVSPYRVNSRSPLAGVKSCNYLEQILSLDEAIGRGFNEAVRLNERGEATSAAMANVFWLMDGKLFTPSLTTGCLAGTTREYILENIECQEVEATLDDITHTEAIFLTSAGLGVVQVAEFESRILEKIDHPILRLIPKIHS